VDYDLSLAAVVLLCFRLGFENTFLDASSCCFSLDPFWFLVKSFECKPGVVDISLA